MTTTKQFQLGSISTGSLRTEDLLPAFADTCRSLGNPGLTVLGEAYMLINGGEDWDDDLAIELLQDLTDVLQELCPPFVVFGAHEGDGADFGFWPDHDALEEERRYHEPHQVFWLDERQCMVEFHADDVTVTDADTNVLWSTV